MPSVFQQLFKYTVQHTENVTFLKNKGLTAEIITLQCHSTVFLFFIVDEPGTIDVCVFFHS